MECKLLVFIILLWYLHMAICENSIGEQLQGLKGDNGKNILMFSDNLMSHIVPLLAVGEELVLRGHNVTLLAIVYPEQQARYKEQVEKYGIKLWNVSSENMPNMKSVTKKAIKDVSKNFISTMITLARDIGVATANITGKHLHKSLSAGDWDVVIGNIFMQPVMACMQSAHNVPFVYIGVNLQSSPGSYPPWPWPGLLFGAASDNLLFADRFLNIIYSQVEYSILNGGMFYLALNAISDYCPSVTLDHTLIAAGTYFPSIIPSVIGFEYPCTISSMTDYVGALIPGSPAPLSEELEEWLGSKPDKTVVYISMGSQFDLNEESGRAILEGVMKTNHSVLWSLRKSNQWVLQSLDVDSDRVLILDWAPQVSILASEAIHSAILHGGFNGLGEALSNGVPVIVLPLMLEQQYSAGRVHYNGLGIMLDPKTVSSSDVAESLRALDIGEYRSKVSHLQKAFRIAGGATRAADLVEFYEDVGYAHLVPAYAKYQWSWVQYYNADVYAVMMVILVTVLMCVRACCKCTWRRCLNKSKPKKD